MDPKYLCIIQSVSLVMNRNAPLKNSYIWVAGAVSLLSFAINPLMIYGIYRTKNSLNPVNKFYIVFGIFNLTETLTELTEHIMAVVKETEFITMETCIKINMMFILLDMTLEFLLMATLLIITCLQYIAITKPIKNKVIEHTVFGGIRKKLIWACGILILTGGYVTVTVVTENKLALILVPILGILIVVVNLYLVHHLNKLSPWNSIATRSPCQQTIKQEQHRGNHHKHAVATLLLITTILTTFNIPNIVMLYILQLHEHKNIHEYMRLLRIAEWTSLLLLASRGIHPLVYIVRNRNINSLYRERFTITRPERPRRKRIFESSNNDVEMREKKAKIPTRNNKSSHDLKKTSIDSDRKITRTFPGIKNPATFPDVTLEHV